MNKKLTVALVFTLIAAIVFCGLWIYEKNDRSDMEKLCQYNALQALENFRQYKSSNSEGDYWEGVANFKAFLNTWLTIEGESSADYLWCNGVYGFMVLQPEKVQANIEKLLTAMEIIGEDYTHPSGYQRMNELDNLLKHE